MANSMVLMYVHNYVYHIASVPGAGRHTMVRTSPATVALHVPGLETDCNPTSCLGG